MLYAPWWRMSSHLSCRSNLSIGMPINNFFFSLDEITSVPSVCLGRLESLSCLWTCYKRSIGIGGPRTECSAADGISWEQSRGRESPPSPSDHFSRKSKDLHQNAAHGTIGFLGCKCTLLACIDGWNTQHLQVLPCKVIHLSPSVQMLGIALTQLQDLALGPVEFHMVCRGPPLKLVKVLLGDISSH